MTDKIITFKFILSYIFCFLSGMVIGAGAISLDYNHIKFGVIMIMFGLLSFLLTVGFISNIFKITHIESELTHRINSIYTDID